MSNGLHRKKRHKRTTWSDVLLNVFVGGLYDLTIGLILSGPYYRRASWDDRGLDEWVQRKAGGLRGFFGLIFVSVLAYFFNKKGLPSTVDPSDARVILVGGNLLLAVYCSISYMRLASIMSKIFC